MYFDLQPDLSTREGLREEETACGCWSVSLKTLSMTESSVLVVSRPQKAHQSFTTRPAERTSLPLLTVPAWGGGEKTGIMKIIISHFCYGMENFEERGPHYSEGGNR